MHGLKFSSFWEKLLNLEFYKPNVRYFYGLSSLSPIMTGMQNSTHVSFLWIIRYGNSELLSRGGDMDKWFIIGFDLMDDG